MDFSPLANALMLVVTLSMPFIGAALVGALVGGVLKVTTQIEDQVIGFAGKLAAVALLGYFTAHHYYSEIASFTSGVWGNSSLYH